MHSMRYRLLDMKGHMDALTESEIRELLSDEFQRRLAELWKQFREANAVTTRLAKEIGRYESHCPHRNKWRTDNNCAWFCPDCGQYVGVDTTYSPKTEKFFKILRGVPS